MDLKQSILDADDLKSKVLKVPEWGVDLHLRTMTAGDRVALGELANQHPEQPWSCAVIVAAALDEDGNRIFADSDVPLLAKKSADVVGRVAREIELLSGLGRQAEATEKKA